MALIKQLSIDGVIGDIYDDTAIHESDVIQTVLNVLNAPEIRTALLNMYHPIGSYYFTDRNVNPGTFLGGIWTNVEGRVLLGASDTYPVNSEGGSADAVVVSHTHTATCGVQNTGAHTHSVSGTAAANGGHNHYAATLRKDAYGKGNLDALMGYGWNGKTDHKLTSTVAAHTHSVSGTAASAGNHSHSVVVTIDAAGESGVGKNMMPYKAAYIWVRTE